MTLTDEIRTYIDLLIARCPKVREVWLIGSRANGISTEVSDWDFIIFADPKAFDDLAHDKVLHREDVDLLVVDDATGEFSKPWGKEKTGSLDSWKWVRESNSIATYRAMKWVEDEEAKEDGFENIGQFVERQCRGYRMWPLLRPRLKTASD